ncbi:MinD/ParA family protein [Pelotomaculum terephthalicicum JT]|uniref:MinD/ParA family protein n=1 Tax=Pelotomaculum TaxID=191373 RepID=UPI0009CA4690|nr:MULTISPECIES: MinD/ParA family protein [Pelotomaculum]MCG9967964.1 MinD/ParA family protein [Pelotomaculum terephthalicicum JT]OPX88564.1 MAG: Flagellum site-determining protein YlxH [Pelotomaculum sp. PtaB.Bin117]OPY63063.1 MAG: Flagellum site-determining protein YlxH [Pelotomaculum sp. PtaU1.Bin065]
MKLWPPRAGRIYRGSIAKSENMPYGPRAIAVASGKGGVGKTSLSVNLALCLAGMGLKVTLFDADLGLANAEVMLGLTPRFSLYEVLYGDKTIDEIIVPGPLGINVISGGSGCLEMANLDHARRQWLLKMFDRFSAPDDVLIIDNGAGINKNVLGFLAAAGEVIIVVTPDPTSLTDAYALIKVLANYKVHSEVYLVVNRAAGRQEAMRTLSKIQAVAGRFLEIKINSLGWIPEDKQVAQAIKRQQPFFTASPSSAASRSVAGMAELLTGGTRSAAAGGGFWSKLMGLFC